MLLYSSFFTENDIYHAIFAVKASFLPSLTAFNSARGKKHSKRRIKDKWQYKTTPYKLMQYCRIKIIPQAKGQNDRLYRR
ncbi:hypothetical protein Shew_3653 [Shewanella loihica PV-4]|uniref:Uncharacterized protein n=1 Tax=Shewanella loihica (strain ATCC BAA-1088 / PV-4) TaxID=323850 RepID=A3QJ71_SHELP|nr:hypothetical protein Shew_3653 [Shewanella loihica PV-4]